LWRIYNPVDIIILLSKVNKWVIANHNPTKRGSRGYISTFYVSCRRGRPVFSLRSVGFAALGLKPLTLPSSVCMCISGQASLMPTSALGWYHRTNFNFFGKSVARTSILLNQPQDLRTTLDSHHISGNSQQDSGATALPDL
jgi:hypothetical protein